MISSWDLLGRCQTLELHPNLLAVTMEDQLNPRSNRAHDMILDDITGEPDNRHTTDFQQAIVHTHFARQVDWPAFLHISDCAAAI